MLSINSRCVSQTPFKISTYKLRDIIRYKTSNGFGNNQSSKTINMINKMASKIICLSSKLLSQQFSFVKNDILTVLTSKRNLLYKYCTAHVFKVI